MRPSRAQLQQAAEEVHDRLVWLYHHNVDAVGWCRDLCGACAVASYMLFYRLCQLGVNSKLVIDEDEEHAFVMVGRIVVDATATQFGEKFPTAVIGTRTELRKRWGTRVVQALWTVGKVFDDAESFAEAVQDWDECQQPVKYVEMGLI